MMNTLMGHVFEFHHMPQALRQRLEDPNYLGSRYLPRGSEPFWIPMYFSFSDEALRNKLGEITSNELRVGVALQVGFLLMSGRLLGAKPTLPIELLRHVMHVLNLGATDLPDVEALQAMYRNTATLILHQHIALDLSQRRWAKEADWRALRQVLREATKETKDYQSLLLFARQWLYRNRVLVAHERRLLPLILEELGDQTEPSIQGYAPSQERRYAEQRLEQIQGQNGSRRRNHSKSRRSSSNRARKTEATPD